MSAPNIVFYHEDDATLVSAADPIEFGKVDPGMESDVITIHIWNDKDGVLTADTAVAPRLYAVGIPDDVSVMFAGTPLNDNHSMMEGRSCTSLGTPADQQRDWSSIGPNELLHFGSMPYNSMRSIELRLKVPADTEVMPASGWQLRCLYS